MPPALIGAEVSLHLPNKRANLAERYNDPKPNCGSSQVLRLDRPRRRGVWMCEHDCTAISPHGLRAMVCTVPRGPVIRLNWIVPRSLWRRISRHRIASFSVPTARCSCPICGRPSCNGIWALTQFMSFSPPNEWLATRACTGQAACRRTSWEWLEISWATYSDSSEL